MNWVFLLVGSFLYLSLISNGFSFFHTVVTICHSAKTCLKRLTFRVPNRLFICLSTLSPLWHNCQESFAKPLQRSCTHDEISSHIIMCRMRDIPAMPRIRMEPCKLNFRKFYSSELLPLQKRTSNRLQWSQSAVI